MLRRLGGVLAVIGFVVLLGTVGGSDADLFGWDRLFLQLDISILLIVAGGISIYIDDVRQHSGRRRKKRTKSPSLSLRESQPLQGGHPFVLRTFPLPGEYPLGKGRRRRNARGKESGIDGVLVSEK